MLEEISLRGAIVFELCLVGVLNSLGLESVFEKLRFRDGLVWTAGLTVEIKMRLKLKHG